MYPAAVRYLRGTSTQEVLDVLAELGSDARVLAGWLCQPELAPG